MLLPRREYSRVLAPAACTTAPPTRIAKVLDDLPHCNVTIVPYHLGAKGATPEIIAPIGDAGGRGGDGKAKGRQGPGQGHGAADDRHRRLRHAGRPRRRSRDVAVPPAGPRGRQGVLDAGAAVVGCRRPRAHVVDDTGAIAVVFFGRRQLAGRRPPGTKLVVEGVVGEHRGKMAMLNPAYEIQADAHAESARRRLGLRLHASFTPARRNCTPSRTTRRRR